MDNGKIIAYLPSCAVLVRRGKKHYECDCPHLSDFGDLGVFTVRCDRTNRQLKAKGSFHAYEKVRKQLGLQCPNRKAVANA